MFFDFLFHHLKRKGHTITMKGTFQITLTVDPAPLAVDPAEDLGVVGTALPAGDKLPISGGTPPYTINNVTGTVPPGVTINSDGTITGTPTQAGSFPLTVDVQDSQG
jgi:hypothetical protein